MPLDFKELGSISPAGRGLQLLMREIGEKLKYEVVLGGVGADGGRDLIFSYRLKSEFIDHPFRVLVDCKDNSKSGKSVNVADVGNFAARIRTNKCNALLLACTTDFSDDLLRTVQEISEQDRFHFHILPGLDLANFLLQRKAEYTLVLARFFPRSISQIFENDLLPITYLFKSLSELNNDEKTIELLNEMLSETTDPWIIWQVIDHAINQLELPLTSLASLLPYVCKSNSNELTSAVESTIDQKIYEYCEDKFDKTRIYETISDEFDKAGHTYIDSLTVTHISEAGNDEIEIGTSGTVVSQLFSHESSGETSFPLILTLYISADGISFADPNIDTSSFFE